MQLADLGQLMCMPFFQRSGLRQPLRDNVNSGFFSDYSMTRVPVDTFFRVNSLYQNGVPPSAKTTNQQYLMNTDSVRSYIPLGSKLADELLRMEEIETPGLDLLQAIFNRVGRDAALLELPVQSRVPCQTPQQWGASSQPSSG
jgi:hypothetical protein